MSSEYSVARGEVIPTKSLWYPAWTWYINTNGSSETILLCLGFANRHCSNAGISSSSSCSFSSSSSHDTINPMCHVHVMGYIEVLSYVPLTSGGAFGPAMRKGCLESLLEGLYVYAGSQLRWTVQPRSCAMTPSSQQKTRNDWLIAPVLPGCVPVVLTLAGSCPISWPGLKAKNTRNP